MLMDETESRNMGCSCGCSWNNNVDNSPSNVFNYMNTSTNMNNSNNTDMNSCECEEFRKTRQCMLKEIKSLEFAIIELALYLDTHPDDSRALCLHRKYARELRDLKDKYQKVYGPLTINFPCNKWRWLEEPWPWERGNM